MSTSSADDDLLDREIGSLDSLLSQQRQAIVVKDAMTPKVSSSSFHKSMGAGGYGVQIQRISWQPANRTLHVSLYPEPMTPPPAGSQRGAATGGDHSACLLLSEAVELSLFFPESGHDPPFCFGSTDHGAAVAAVLNGTLQPVRSASLLHALAVIVNTTKHQVNPVKQLMGMAPKARFKQALRQRLEACALSADLLVSLLSMSKIHHSLRPPVPKCFTVDGHMDRTRLLRSLETIPPFQAALQAGQFLDQLPMETCALLNHIFFRTRSTIRQVVDPQDPLYSTYAGLQVASERRPAYIFQVADSESPQFQMLSHKYGTQRGFHGSNAENFYSIFAYGLMNLSGTQAMKNGAAFGDGIYLAADVKVARHFASWGTKVWSGSMFGTPSGKGFSFGYQVVALCEFVNMPCYGRLLDSRADTAYYVIADTSHVAIKALFLFRDPASQPAPRSTATHRRSAEPTRTSRPPPVVSAKPPAPTPSPSWLMGFNSRVQAKVLVTMAFVVALVAWIYTALLRWWPAAADPFSIVGGR